MMIIELIANDADEYDRRPPIFISFRATATQKMLNDARRTHKAKVRSYGFK